MHKTKILLSFFLLPCFAENFTLPDVLKAAVVKAKTEDARLNVAQGQLILLEAQNKWKLELRPSWGMFAFTNPALLAANLGANLLSGKHGAPSALAIKNAQLDVAAAELRAEHLKVSTQITAARDYFDLLAKQQMAASAKAMVESRRLKMQEVDALLKKSKVTLLDKMAIEQELLEMEQHALEAETQRRIAATNLAFTTGFKAGTDLTVQDVTLAQPVSSGALPGVEQLLKSAMLYRKEPAILRNRIDELRKQLTKTKGGKTSYGRSEMGVAITLKDNGEKDAERNLIEARLQLLELELESMETELRRELAEVRHLAAASGDKEQIQIRKLELAQRRQKVLSIRAQNGLDGSLAGMLAAEGSLAEKRDAVEATFEQKISMFTLMVLCGVEDQNNEVLAKVLGS